MSHAHARHPGSVWAATGEARITCTSSSSQSGGVLQQLPRCGIAHSSSLSWLASRATPAHRRWPRRMHPSPLPSIILTLPFHSEFQIPQNGIPHSNFLSHSKVEPFAPNTNIKSTTGYWAPVRIRLPAGAVLLGGSSSPLSSPACCSSRTTAPARLALPRLEEHHPHPGGASRGHGRRRRAATSSRGSSVYRPARASRRRAHFSLLF